MLASSTTALMRPRFFIRCKKRGTALPRLKCVEMVKRCIKCKEWYSSIHMILIYIYIYLYYIFICIHMYPYSVSICIHVSSKSSFHAYVQESFSNSQSPQIPISLNNTKLQTSSHIFARLGTVSHEHLQGKCWGFSTQNQILQRHRSHLNRQC